MSEALLVIMPGNELRGSCLASVLDAEIAEIEHRRFPDDWPWQRRIADHPGLSAYQAKPSASTTSSAATIPSRR